MKNAVALIAVAGIASVAAAQNFSIDLTPSASSVAEGTSFTVSVYGNADQGTHLLGGEFSLVSGSGLIDSMSWSNAAWSGFTTDGGYAGGGDYNSVIFGQLVIPPIFPPAPGSELGQAIGSFTISGEGTGTVNFALTAGSPFTLEAVDSVSGATQNDGGAISLGSVDISFVPAPSAMALLGLGGLVAGRRRR